MVLITEWQLVRVLNEMLLSLEQYENRAPRRKEGDFSLIVERSDNFYQITQHVPMPGVGLLGDVRLVPIPEGWRVLEATRFTVVDGVHVISSMDESSLQDWLRTFICRGSSEKSSE